jgi:hypothetical protein
MALLEAAQGDPVRWRGAVDPAAATLPGRVEWPAELLANGDVSRVFAVASPVTTLTWAGTGDELEGAPSAEVRVDGRAVGRWTLDGDGRVPVDLAPGPHRVTLRFDTDRVGPGGDRNIHLQGLRGE